MNISKIILAAVIVALSPHASAGDADVLIELDKQWGSATGTDSVSEFVSQDLVAIGSDGITGISEMTAALADAPAPSGDYVASNYQVKYLTKDIAVMVHTTTGEDAHASMHVYQKQGDKWLVVAHGSAPMDK